MLKQKADLDASLHILQAERAAAVASAEAAAYEEEEEELESGKLHVKPVPDMQSMLLSIPVSMYNSTQENLSQNSHSMMSH